MASGIEHERAYNRSIGIMQPVCGLACFALGYYGFLPLIAAPIGFVFGLYIGRSVDPDLDMIQITISERRVMQKNRVIGRLWRRFWRAYAKNTPHRSKESHMPLVGTWGRWRRLLLAPCLLGLIGTLALYQGNESILMAYFLFWVSEFAGQAWQDTLHWWMDGRPRFG